jgi:hypothetical protein
MNKQYGTLPSADLWLGARRPRGWLDKLNGFLLPFYLVGMVTAVVWAAAKYGHSTEFLNVQPAVPLPLPGWLMASCSYMGVWVLMMYTMDFARLGKREDKEFNGWVTFGPVFYLGTFLFSGLVGIYLANTVPLDKASGFGEAGAAVAIVKLMGVLGVVLILVTQTRINSANLYPGLPTWLESSWVVRGGF